MSLRDVLAELIAGPALNALATRFGVSVDEAASAAREIVPALAAAAKRRLGTLEGAAAIAGLLRRDDAGDSAMDPVSEAVPLEQKGVEFLDQLFGAQRYEVEEAIAVDAAAASGLEQTRAQQMIPMVAGLILGALQRRESGDSIVRGVVGGLLERVKGRIGEIRAGARERIAEVRSELTWGGVLRTVVKLLGFTAPGGRAATIIAGGWPAVFRAIGRLLGLGGGAVEVTTADAAETRPTPTDAAPPVPEEERSILDRLFDADDPNGKGASLIRRILDRG